MSVVKVPKELKIRNVSEIFETIDQKEPPLEVILDDVTDIDGAGLQLIIHLYNMSQKDSEKYKIVNNSSELIDKFKKFGFKPNKSEE